VSSITINSPGGRALELAPDAFVARLTEARGQVEAPFSDARLALAAEVGTTILRRGGQQVSPAVVHFAYWTRSAALKRLAGEFRERLPSGCQARPIGLVFHLPPQNVETVFLYSWMLSYLAGNANVVRLPTALGEEMRSLLDLFLAAFERAGETSQLFVNYPSASDLSVRISAESDARIVWGGDAKVRAFADVPLRLGGKSVWFGDRFSLSALNGPALASLDAKGRRSLAEAFYNDVYVFDQMACSSPHVVYVAGDRNAHGEAVLALLQSVAEVAREKQVVPATGHAIRKMVEAFASAGRGDADSLYWGDNLLTAAEVVSPEHTERRVGGGYLEYRFIPHLEALEPVLREHHQTLTYFGFTRDEMFTFAGRRADPGLTRIVPVGQALDFDFVWDGYDLPRELTRLVRVI
jgi:hypothetical protein